MRLLQYSESGELSIHSFDDSAVPPYAILSHTWEADGDEVTFADLQTGGGKIKPGYKKILFCGKQAQHDNLQYFWIDTCCIDTTDKAEHSCAIQSMFHWYRSAIKCYVFLSDVSINADCMSVGPSSELAFRSSRWFTRGWTLQELLAPTVVEFYSQEGKMLGNKTSLKLPIHKTTGIPLEVLSGTPLSCFSIKQRLQWKGDRQTKRDEDAWYSLAGVLDVEIAPAYGEGGPSAFKRLMDEVHKLERCIQDIRQTDPRDDKKRIEETKGGLLVDSYRWILDNTAFKQWHKDKHSRLLWVKGDPGKGKTMLLCGVINELRSSLPQNTLLSYFFCQATDSRINSATAVLRGLLYMLIHQQPSLVSHVRKKHDHAGKSLFEDANAWVALTEIFANVLQDASLGTTYIIIDALDECITNQLKLLCFIVEQSSMSSRVKWIVSSRNWPTIEEQLERVERKTLLSLELNAELVSAAVKVFIQQKVSRLAQEKRYTPEMQDAVLQHLTSNANDTFLWVALVCQDLKATPKWDVHLVNDLESVREIIGLCRSFLTLRDDTVYFVHQSAKDFLTTKALNDVFLDGIECVHQDIFAKSLVVLHKTLRRDIYNLQAPGYAIEDAKPLFPDPLAASRYPCVYWIDHFCDSKSSATNQEITRTIDAFLEQKYLYWLEALSLCRSMAKGVVSITRLWNLVQGLGDTDVLNKIVYDARRFIMYHKEAIENYPLQAYASALLFSPANSIVRRLFQHEEPRGVTIKPAISNGWSACLQTLEGHSSGVTSVTFSHDSTRLASASEDSTVKIWDASSGTCVHTLQGHSDAVMSVTFSHDSTRLASASDDRTVKIWNVSSGTCLQTLEGHSSGVTSVTFSHDSTRLASASGDSTVKIWDASSGTCVHVLEGHSGWVTSVAFSHDSTWLASASADSTVKIWEASSGMCVHTLKGHGYGVSSVAFSHNSTWLASSSWDDTVKIWDVGSGTCVHTLEGHGYGVSSVAFSHDSTRLASASASGYSTVKIWDASSGTCLHTLQDHTWDVKSVTFSHDSTRLASASDDSTVKIWDMSNRTRVHTLEDHSKAVTSVAFSHDSTRLASASMDTTVKIWDASSRTCVHTLQGHSDAVISVAFSHDSTRLASSSWDDVVKIWDVGSGTCLHTLKGYSSNISLVDFSLDSTQLAPLSDDNYEKIWEMRRGMCVHTLKGYSNAVTSVAFSHDSTRLASALNNSTVKIWNVSSGTCVHTLEGHSDSVRSVAFSHDSTRLASASDDSTVKIWDASSEMCLHTLDVGISLLHLSFDFTGTLLYTEIGTISISSSQVTNPINVAASKLQYQGASINSGGNWVIYAGSNMLWIPSEYRPSSSAE
ncbi:beta transducin-like protein HET-D2Y [Curvularia clavata]|uniref:Beta transducin-like protein HET-D2Y n=1 Tax=Curvularia clavata TaxID=95742 RepID=A0A9Q9DQ46_CURCL|nr:beta transducin-like protein HET-D2Y [Curvularia clavata]